MRQIQIVIGVHDERRPVRVENEDDGDEEVVMVLPLRN